MMTTELNEPELVPYETKVVLIIEDSVLDAMIIQNMIESTGSTAFCASSYQVALEVTNAMKFSALTVDVNLTGSLTGPEMIEQLGLVGTQGIDLPKVVVITGERLTDEQVAQYKARGFTEVLFKPVEPAVLLQVLGISRQ